MGSPQSGGALAGMTFLTVAEAQVDAGLEATVHRLVHAGDLTAVRVGRSLRVPEEAVQQYLREALPARHETADQRGGAASDESG